ncbi:hypothetical protein [Streptomyces sp. NPDC049949]|uniref:hypothetical protein n=1 Tax=Streptomyces sp. NPDC049949 TaxID=3154627 RepID=UPI003418A98B
MITLTETLAVRTVPGFLDPKEISGLTALLDDHLATTGWRPVYVGEVLDDLPARVPEVLGSAVAGHLPEIRQMFPSAVGASPWQFIETGPGDGVWDKRRDAGPHAGYEPGMRFTRIAPHGKISCGERGTSWIHTVTGSPRFLPADTGTATVYGAQLIHGINPVHQGRCRKFITGLTSGR